MTLVVVADDTFTFLFCWEFMSLSSWALVMAHEHVRENLRAGYVYLVMASFGTLALLLAFGLLTGPDGAYAFDAIRGGHPSPALVALVLILVLIGTGSKAGLVPLHAWLPLAHPAAPSHVSGLLSGVMTKVAVYAFVRIVFDLLGDPVWWWSMVVLALAGVTCVMGVLYALMQHDLKRHEGRAPSDEVVDSFRLRFRQIPTAKIADAAPQQLASFCNFTCTLAWGAGTPVARGAHLVPSPLQLK
jgi:formate hydrogenlyase subunit 3/multisubunit Na+/H+ antiporter MnhD subunit